MGTKRKMLSDWQADYILDLMRLIETQSKQTLAKWAIDYAKDNLLVIWIKYYPDDNRAKDAILASKLWLRKEINLTQAKPLILTCHQAAKEKDDNPAAQAAARAIAQSCSTIHSARHCIGLALYGALALAYDNLGVSAKWEDLEKYAAKECVKMTQNLASVAIVDELNPAKINWHC